MNARTLNLLILITIIAVALALLAIWMRPAPPAPQSPDLLFPNLRAQANDIAAIEIRSHDQSTRLEKHDAGWTVADRAGYPASFEPIKQLILELADLRPAESKTANPEHHARLGVADPAPGSSSIRLALFTESGADAASLILGDRAPGAPRGERFARIAGQNQVWLIELPADPRPEPDAWHSTEIMRIDRSRIARITIEQPEGPDLVLIPAAVPGAFTIEDLPEDMQVSNPGLISQVGAALGFVSFRNVRPASHDEALPPESRDRPMRAIYDTNDGLRITVLTWREDNATWATFRAEPHPDAEDPDATRSAADQLDANLAPWTFSIDDIKSAAFRPTRGVLIAPKPPETDSQSDSGDE